MADVAAAVLALIAIASLTGLLAPLPRAVLSAIVIQAVWGLMDVSALRRYRHIRRNDFSAAIAAMIGVLVLGPPYGLLVAIGLAVLGLVYRSSRVETDIMGKVPGEKAAWGSLDDHPERRTYDGVVVLRLDVPLFWANATEIRPCPGSARLAPRDTGPPARPRGDEPAAERIVIDHDVTPPALAADADVAPRGGYRDPGRRRS